MKNRRPQPRIPQKLIQGKTGQSQPAKAPKPMVRGGRIDTQLKPINWTRNKLTLTILFLATPYVITIFASFRAGINIIGLTLIGLAILMGILYLILRFIENGDL